MYNSRRDIGRTVGSILGIIVISLLVVTAFSGPVTAHTGDDGFHHHDGWMGAHTGTVGGFGFVWMILWTLVLIGTPVVLIYLLLTGRESTDRTTEDDALSLLRQRYARGEIDEEEFETRYTKLQAEQN